jgi:hypothetical protein
MLGILQKKVRSTQEQHKYQAADAGESGIARKNTGGDGRYRRIRKGAQKGGKRNAHPGKKSALDVVVLAQ